MSVIIRAVESHEFESWKALWSAYLEFYQTSVEPQVFATTFERLIKGNAGVAHEFRGLVAEVDGEMVGLVHYLYHRHNWRIEDVCYLQDLFVDPGKRGFGIGRALIEAVYQAADQEGAGSVYWLTQETNYTGRRLYDQLAHKTEFIQYRR